MKATQAIIDEADELFLRRDTQVCGLYTPKMKTLSEAIVTSLYQAYCERREREKNA